MIVSVDTNILLDILLPDPMYKDTSMALLVHYIKAGRIIISDIVYSELASQFKNQAMLTGFLNDTGIQLVGFTTEALWISAKAWEKYLKTRDKSIQCSCCGWREIIKCPSCHQVITSKQHILSDFLIAGHAVVESGTLLTRDRGFYKTYFPELKLICSI